MMNLTTLPLSFWDYVLESATRILNMVPTKKVDKTPYELWDNKGTMGLTISYFPLKTNSCCEMKITSHSEITSKVPMEVEGFEPPQKEEIPICRSERTRRAPDRLCLNVEAEEHSLRDLNEPPSYKAMMLDSESNKWIDAMNEEIQSMNGHIGMGLDLGEAAFILGIKIYRDRSKRLIGLGQNAYMDKILKRYKMDNSKRGHIPMQERLDLNKTQGASTPKEVKRMQNVPYASVVGSIMYAVRCTRPDVAFAQNITSRFQQNPGELHWTAVKNILKYLRNTKDMFLVYGGNPEAELRVDCYCNAGFETDIDDMKSLTGYVSF
ncbi:hypothetical protein Tco_0117927 [Tanacetum coccineum]